MLYTIGVILASIFSIVAASCFASRMNKSQDELVNTYNEINKKTDENKQTVLEMNKCINEDSIIEDSLESLEKNMENIKKRISVLQDIYQRQYRQEKYYTKKDKRRHGS